MNQFVSITKALADKSRMRVIAALMIHEELCVCQIVEILKFATPTVSRHMAVLQGAHLVQSRKDGRWVYYRISNHFPAALRQWFEDEVFNAEEIKADRVVLKEILSATVDELCRNQKERKMYNE